jgi:hypothetical protein
VNLYDGFMNDANSGEAHGTANSLFRSDGLHPRAGLGSGDDLIAFEIAGAINSVPEPSTGLLVSLGLVAICASRRTRRV